MINLLKNEILKIMKKKSFLIMMIVIVGYVLLTNGIYHSIDSLTNDWNVFEQTEEGDLNSEPDQEIYDDYYALVNKFSDNSWQKEYLEEDFDYSLLDVIAEYEDDQSIDEDDQSIDEETYELAKDKYEKIKSALEKDDWRLIAKISKKDYEDELLQADEDEAEEIKIQIEGIDLRLDMDISYQDSYQNTNLETYINSKILLLRYKNVNKLSADEEEQYASTREECLTSQYALSHNLNIDEFASLQSILGNFFSEYFLIIVIMIFMIAGTIMSKEYNNGTVKFLLIRPYSRVKILLSKYLAVILNILIACLLVFIVQMIVGGLFFGFDSLSTPVIVYSSISDSITTYNVFHYLLLQFISVLPELLLLATFVFCIGTLFANTSLAIVLGYVANIVGSLVTNLINPAKWWANYIVSFHWDLTSYLFNQKPIIANGNLLFSLFICFIYLLLMLIPTFIIFHHKDIKNV